MVYNLPLPIVSGMGLSHTWKVVFLSKEIGNSSTFNYIYITT